MRYDDASQTGSAAADHDPIARPDLDGLAAGNYGPATGNAITGSGTMSGSAGADSVPDAPGKIVEVHGAGGAATGANGSFQATGQYGELTIDARGNFSYVRNQGTPDGVQDVFNYTLADRDGGTSSTTLTIDIGKQPTQTADQAATAAAVAAAAAQGIVNLPAGVELSDIHVNGRDLVINMPDGTQMVIPGGAVFVPEIVIGNVEVPPSNLAALLIDSEPKPAAGAIPSSGGNFADPVPPLDPGVPLGDLIPPTELAFQPPEFHEVNQFIDREPTVIIETPDNPAGAVNAVDEVHEAGLPARNSGEPAGSGEIADGNGTNNSDPSEGTTGTIVYTADDGLQGITINGVLVTGVIGQQIDGTYGTLTITSIADGQIGYSYVLGDNTIGNATHDDFTVVVTDSDGDTATGTLTVGIVNDVPNALNDTDALAGNATTTDGNVITGVGTTSGNAGKDVSGADGVLGETNGAIDGVTGILAGTSGAFTSVAQNGTGTIVHGTFGDLTIFNDGHYTYTRTDTQQSGTDVFTYQLTDGDGDTDTATLTIAVPNVNTIPSIGPAEDLTVDEDGLGTANPQGDPHGGNVVDTGQVVVQYGNDVPANLTSAIAFINPSSLNGQLTQDGQPITFSIDGTGHLIGQVNGTGPAVITIAFTGASAGSNGQVTYSYQVTLSDNVDQAFGDQTENGINLNNVQFQVTDSNGDHAPTPGSFDVTIFDDVPVVGERSVTVGTVYEDGLAGGNAEDLPNQPASHVISASTLAALVSGGADSPVSISLNLATTGADSLEGDATGLTQNGVSIVWHVSGGQLEGVLANDSSHVVFTLANGPGSDFTFTLVDNIDNTPTAAGDSDVDSLSIGGAFIATDTDGDQVGLGGHVSINIQNDVPTIGDGKYSVGTVYEDALPGGNSESVSQVTTATISASSLAALVNDGADSPVTIGLNLATSGDSSLEGDATGLTQDGISIVWHVDGTTLEGVLANDSSHVVFTITGGPGSDFTFTLVDNIDNTPTAAGDSDVDALSLSGAFIATDTDGDSVAITGNVSVDIQNDVPTVANAYDVGKVYEDALGTGNSEGGGQSATATISAASLAGLVSDGADSPVAISLNLATTGDSSLEGDNTGLTQDGTNIVWHVDGTALEGVLATDPTHVVFTITSGPGSDFTFTLVDHIDNNPTAAGDSDVDSLDIGGAFLATDTDGDSVSLGGHVSIDIENDVPTAVVPVENQGPIIGGLVDEDDLPVTGNHDSAPGDDNPIDAAGDSDPLTTGGLAGSLDALFKAGADRPLSYGLDSDTSAIEAQNLTSNGHALLYDVTGNVLTAYADLNDNGDIDNGETKIFELTVNTDGSWTFKLDGELDHPSQDGTPDDNTENNLLIDLGSVVVATDTDGDQAHAAPGAFVVNVDDDMPKPFDACPDQVNAINGVGSTDTENLNLPAVGADQPGVVSFVVHDGDPVLDSDGNQLSSEGHLLYYSLNASDPTILEARTSATPGEGDLVFQIDLDQSAGTYTYTQFGTITSEHELSITDLSSVGGGNVDAKAIDVPSSPFDLILSTSSGNTVNTSADWIGVSGGQSMQAGDVIRVDFVQNAFVTGSGGGAVLNFGEYYDANSFREDVGGLNNVQFASFTVHAVLVNEAPGSQPSDPADGDNTFYGDTNDTFVATTALNIYNDSGTLVNPANYGSLGITVTATGDGGWSITGLPQGYDFEITSSTAFQAVQIDADTGSDTFKLGAIDVTTVVQSTVDLSVPIALTDADGDSVTCDLGVHLDPGIVAPSLVLQVDEAGLPTVGSNSASDSENASGTLADIVTGGHGPYTFALDGSGDGAHGTLTIQPDGSYTYTLDTPVDGTTADNGTNLQGGDTFHYTATDADGNVSQGTISVNVVDDVPTAVDDTDAVTEGFGHQTAGNVITGVGGDLDASGADTKGADGATVTGARLGTEAGGGSMTAVSGATVIHGVYGDLSISATGGYTYTLTTNSIPTNVDHETFTYQLTDGDGDTDQAELVITLNQDQNVPNVSGDASKVYEDGLADGVQHGANSETDTTGQFVVNPHGESYTLTLNSTVVDSVGDTVDTGKGILTITSISAPDGSGNITYGYSYTLSAALTHTGQGEVNDITDTITMSITDATGDSDSTPGSIVVSIVDDVPIAANDTDAVTEGLGHSTTGNVISGVGGDLDPAGADNIGADGGGTITGARLGTEAGGGSLQAVSGATVIHGLYGDLSISPSGSYTYTLTTATIPTNVDHETFTYQVADGDGDTDTAELVITLNQNASIPNVTGTTATVYEDGLADGAQHGANSETTTGSFVVNPNGEGYTLTLNSTVVDSVGDTVDTGKGVLTITSISAPDGSGNITYGFSYTLSAALTHTGQGEVNNILDTITMAVTDATGDSDPTPGSIVVSIVDDVPVATSDGNLATVDDNVSGVTIGTVAGLLSNDQYGADGQGSPAITIATGNLGGTVSIVAGNLVYTSNHNTAPGATDTETFTYTIKDGDGDTTTAQFTVKLTDGGPSISSVAASISVDEEGLTGGNAGTTYSDGSDLTGTSVHQTGTLAGLNFGVDGAGNIVLGAVADTGLRTISNEVVKSAWDGTTHTLTGFVDTNGNGSVDSGETKVFTMQITNVSTGAYAFDLLQPVTHATAGTEDDKSFSIGVTVTDAEGDPATGTVNVLIDDDSPTLTSVEDKSVPNQINTLTGDIDFSYGADGPGHIVLTPLTTIPGLTYSTEPDGTIVATVGGNTYFTLDVDETTGQYTLDIQETRPVVSTPIDLTTIHSGNYDTVTVGDSTFDGLTFTGTLPTTFTNPNGPSDSVNVSGNGFGTGNNLENDNDGFLFANNNSSALDFTLNFQPNTSSVVVSWAAYTSDPRTGGVAIETGTMTVNTDADDLVPISVDPNSNFNYIVVRFDVPSGSGVRVQDFSVVKDVIPANQVISFGVQVVDGDGDPISGHGGTEPNTQLDFTFLGGPPLPPASPIAPLSFKTASVSDLSLLTSNDNDTQQKFSGTSNTVLMGAVAAAGLSSPNQLAAQELDHHSVGGNKSAPIAAGGVLPNSHSVEGSKAGSASDLMVQDGQPTQHTQLVGRTALSNDTRGGQHGGEHQQAGTSQPTELLQDSGTPAHSNAPAVPTAAGVAMPSAAMLQAIAGKGGGHENVDAKSASAGGEEHTQVVSKVLADALQGGAGHGPNIDALLNAATGQGNHGGKGLEALASQGHGAVPNGDTSVFAAFAGGHSMQVTDQMAMHPDAPPAHA